MHANGKVTRQLRGGEATERTETDDGELFHALAPIVAGR
jgi:hypothetical protein